MTTKPVKGLVCKMAVPTIIAMVTTALYNVADAAFIGHLGTAGTAGTAGVGISFAYMTFIQALGFFFGHGSGNHISRALGAKDVSSASVVATVGFFTPFLLGLLAAACCLPSLSWLSRLLGAPESVVPQTNDYLRYIVVATPFMMSALTLNNQLRLQGNARFGMVGIVSGAILNIALDPLFIFGFDMGVSGASLATAISQVFAWGLLLYGTFRPESVHIRLRDFKPSWRVYYEIFRGGLPSFFRQVFNCAAVVSLNYCAAHYAASPEQEASAVAAFAVVTRIMMFAFSVVLGFSQGFQPVCGYNYGAKLYGRVRESWLFASCVGTAFLLVISAVGLLFAPQIVALFRSEDPALIEIGAVTLRWQCAAFPLVALFTTTGMLFQNIRMTGPATLLSVCRNGLFFLPALIMLPLWLGLQGVQMAQAVADLLTFLLCIPYAVWINRKLKNEMK
ncbi:MAG: MATE family efflux transporter [Bacteroidales bacterium]|nr:MATE family efflux transporter [Bacteroidales bacterium]